MALSRARVGGTSVGRELSWSPPGLWQRVLKFGSSVPLEKLSQPKRGVTLEGSEVKFRLPAQHGGLFPIGLESQGTLGSD